ncbi:hypothetical protein BT63DRAFT_200503 [Microthyrium microscopicum]|uniref:HAM1-like N-terminal domain-containing protein n=1 Tax=Microthyrium microscopicum TaxID=703497 RepID=A0A6A6UF01_9PEZI|nr:hypothetical protein BT63DRAFT_200503 [Microthyrium microscopicum]
MFSCFGYGGGDDEHEPLLPQYNDDTTLQRELHKKLHSYQMLQAIRNGYMPSTEQLVANLRSLLGTDVLNPTDSSLSRSGHRLSKLMKDWLKDFMTLLMNKNNDDQVQQLIWDIIHSKVTVDVQDVARQAGKARAKADSAAVYQSLQTVGSLLLTNPDFRLFLSDLSTIGRQVFQDTAHAVSGVAEEAGDRIAPSDDAVAAIQSPGNDESSKDDTVRYPSKDDLGAQVAEVSQVASDGIAKVAEQARDSVTENLSGQQKESLIYRLKQAISRLRKRPDYSDSVSTISLLIKRWALVYSQALQDTASTLQDDVHENAAADRAVRNTWSLLSSLGEKKEWDKLEDCLKQVMSHKDNDPEFDNLITDLSGSVEKLLTDPDFLDHAEEKFNELRGKSEKVKTDSNLRKDLDRLVAQSQRTLQSVISDKDVSNLIRDSEQLIKLVSPSGEYINTTLMTDVLNVFGPVLIQAVQTLPIPRLEVSTPELDLLLENLILTPGHTVNRSSFLPYQFAVSTTNDIVVRKTHTSQIASSLSTNVTLKLDGFSVQAQDVGFWMRTHVGILRFVDSGLASFALDERGIDIHVDVAVAQNSLEQILSLKAVRVHVHKLNFNLKSSTFSICAWLLRPLLRPIIRKVLERQLALAITVFFRAANRELVFARERLRATRIADPKDMLTFFKAVAARLTPEDDPDVYTRVGVDEPGRGVFKGKYAPGSLAKVWAQEGQHAGEIVEDGAEVIGRGKTGWRNEVFDVHANSTLLG